MRKVLHDIASRQIDPHSAADDLIAKSSSADPFDTTYGARYSLSAFGAAAILAAFIAGFYPNYDVDTCQPWAGWKLRLAGVMPGCILPLYLEQSICMVARVILVLGR